jgi:DNA primase
LIKKEDIDRIFEAARIEEVVGDYVALKKRGVNLIGLCPFHDEKTPSFYVSPVKGICKCFGCGKGGNSVNFLMDKEGLSYPDALRQLAKKYNIEIEEQEQTPEQVHQQGERESLFIACSFAQKHFSENLYNTDEGKSVGLGYFRERGFREDIIQKFQLGYSIQQRTAFTDIAIASGYKAEYLVKSGLTIEYRNENQGGENNAQPEAVRYADRFFGRVMFPIHNQTGKVIGFGGRTLRTDKKVAKYINSPETDIYHKSNVLYGLYFSKSAIHKEDNCLLVEGYTDVISMHQAGIENVVASSGTSLTVDQIKLIRRITNNITILYDGDSAGIKASFRGIDLILEEGMNVKVLLFPDGEDPDSYSKRVSSTELKEFISKNSQDFISFKTGLLMQDVKNDPIRKAGLIKDIIESIALIPEAIYRSVYVKECSRIMDVEETVLLSELNKIRAKKFNEKRPSEGEQQQEQTFSPPQNRQADEQASAEFQERDIIRILINYSDKIIKVDSEDENGQPVQADITVAELIIHELQHDNIELENPVYATVYREFVNHVNNLHVVPDQKVFINHEDPAISSLTTDLISSPYTLSNWEQHEIYITTEEEMLRKSVYNAIYALKSRRLEIMIHDIQKRLKEEISEEEMLTLMQTQHALIEAKKVFNALLGRIIVK